MRELSTAVRISDPTPDRFMGDVDPALGEEFLDVTIAQREAEIEPHRVLDDRRSATAYDLRDASLSVAGCPTGG
jgi:hypothetical protein